MAKSPDKMVKPKRSRLLISMLKHDYYPPLLMSERLTDFYTNRHIRRSWNKCTGQKPQSAYYPWRSRANKYSCIKHTEHVDGFLSNASFSLLVMYEAPLDVSFTDLFAVAGNDVAAKDVAGVAGGSVPFSMLPFCM
uniref:Uncharacterized protein n=1 Tax=Ditylenchus dipsaci TaxID=166011 RepID=A0A915DXF2_9BILA